MTQERLHFVVDDSWLRAQLHNIYCDMQEVCATPVAK